MLILVALMIAMSVGAVVLFFMELAPSRAADVARRLEEVQAGGTLATPQVIRRRRRQEQAYPPGALPPIDIEGPATSREPSSARRASMKRRQENLYKMLAISDTVSIRQDGTTLDIVSAVESRRVVAGSRTQVSLPEGELADSKVGWDGLWFVIDRNVRHGPRVVERYRLVPKTGQLEYEMKWSGESEIAGMKIRRVFDRVTVAPLPADPAAGPIK